MQSQLPFTLLQRLAINKLGSEPSVPLNDTLFYQNHREVHKLRNAVRIITAHVIKKQVKYKALIKRLSTKQDKVTKIQKLVRGHLCRVVNA